MESNAAKKKTEDNCCFFSLYLLYVATFVRNALLWRKTDNVCHRIVECSIFSGF